MEKASLAMRPKVLPNLSKLHQVALEELAVGWSSYGRRASDAAPETYGRHDDEVGKERHKSSGQAGGRLGALRVRWSVARAARLVGPSDPDSFVCARFPFF
jgi:hypothetical protein